MLYDESLIVFMLTISGFVLAELGELVDELTPQPKARRASRKTEYVVIRDITLYFKSKPSAWCLLVSSECQNKHRDVHYLTDSNTVFFARPMSQFLNLPLPSMIYLVFCAYSILFAL